MTAAPTRPRKPHPPISIAPAAAAAAECDDVAAGAEAVPEADEPVAVPLDEDDDVAVGAEEADPDETPEMSVPLALALSPV